MELEINQVEGWDSLGHLNLILAIEDEFKIKFTTSQIIEIISIKKIIKTIKEKISANP